MARKIVITSGKGGVGKTTICANMGCSLASMNYRVCMLDLDIGLNNLDVVMGVENKVVYDIVDVINKRCRAKQSLIQDAFYPTLYTLPSAHGNVKITRDQLNKVVTELDPFFDYILLDCPAGIDDGFYRAVECSDEAIVVVTPNISSIRDADKVLCILASMNKPSYGVVNRIRGDMVVSKEMLSVEDIYYLLKVKIIGAVPEDDSIVSLSSMGKTSLKSNHANRAFVLLTQNIVEGTYKIYDCTMPYRGFFGCLRRKIKSKV